MPIIGNPIYQSAFVVDQFSGNGSTTAFTMSVAPAGVTNVLVAVSGVLQDPSTYGVVGNTITFSAAPPSGTGNISCRYLGVPVTGVTTTAYRTVTEFTATASQTTFTPPSYSVGFINVYLNGVLLGSADYTATNGTTVVLATGASAGNLLTVESFLISSVANAIANAAGSVGSNNIANGVTINFADGSASTPSITNDGDTNTGMFFPAADTIAFSEGGVESMRINSSGNIGVGTTVTPMRQTIFGTDNNTVSGANIWNYKIVGVQVRNESTTANTMAGMYFEGGASGNSASAIFNIQESSSLGALGFATGGSGVSSTVPERMRIDSSGRVTTPYQPAFMARTYAGAGNVSGSYTAFTFNNIDINRGNHFNNTTGVFTCPVAGDYYVYLNYNLRVTVADWTSAFILRNGTMIIQSWSRPEAALEYGNTIASCVLSCAVNDTITLAFHNGYSVPHTAAFYNHASIYLLG
jgi:hypothetical protein